MLNTFVRGAHRARAGEADPRHRRRRRAGASTPARRAARRPGSTRQRPSILAGAARPGERALLQVRSQQVQGQGAHDQVRRPHREPGRDPSVVADVLAEGQPDVVEEHDGQERDEGAPSAAPVGPDAERDPQDAKTRHAVGIANFLWISTRYGFGLPLQVDRLLRRLPQLRETHLAVALGRASLLEQGILQHERDVVEPEAHLAVLLERAGAGLVDRAVDEPEGDPPVHLVRQEPALPGRDEPLLVGLPLVRHEDVPESHLVRRDLVHVDDEAPEGVVEQALLQPHRRLRPDDLEHQGLEGVVALRDGVDHQIRGRPRDAEPEHHDGPEQAEGAHAARLQRHDLHVGGKAAEGDQDREQEPDGNGEHQDGRGDVDEHHEDEADGDALVDDEIGEVEDPVDQQQEREDEQTEAERGD